MTTRMNSVQCPENEKRNDQNKVDDVIIVCSSVLLLVYERLHYVITAHMSGMFC